MMKAKGFSQFHFRGGSLTTVCLEFSCAQCAEAAARLLPGWTQQQRWVGKECDSAELNLTKARFAEWHLQIAPCGHPGCSTQCREVGIDSMRHSIDYGPRFEIDVPAVSVNQLDLTLD